MLYIFYNGNRHSCRLFDDDGVEKNRKSYYDHVGSEDIMAHRTWTSFFDRCYLPIKNPIDIINIIDDSDISIKLKNKC